MSEEKKWIMSEEKNKRDYGPLWQLEQQIKHHENLALAHGRDATSYLAKAEDARRMAERYREAYERLKERQP